MASLEQRRAKSYLKLDTVFAEQSGMSSIIVLGCMPSLTVNGLENLSSCASWTSMPTARLTRRFKVFKSFSNASSSISNRNHQAQGLQE